MIEGPPTLDDLEDQFRGLIWNRKFPEALALTEHVMRSFMSKNNPDEVYRGYAWEQRERHFYEWRGCWITMLSVVGVDESDAKANARIKEARKQAAKDRAFARSLGLTVTRKRKAHAK